MKIKKLHTEIKTEDGQCETFAAWPENSKNLPAVIFYMDAIGLRPCIYEMVERLAGQGYFVFAPNLFYREHKVPIINYEKFYQPENQAEVFKEIRAMIGEYSVERGKKDAKAFLDFAKNFPESMIDPKNIAAVGYCMGGAQAIRAAGNFPDEFKAIASFHAGNLATDLETSPHHYFKKIKAEVYIGHADNDHNMPAEMIERVESELKKAQLNYKTELYKNCGHGWTMSDLAVYNKDGEEKHWRELLFLFERTLRSKLVE